MPLSPRDTGTNPGATLAWQILAPLAALFGVLLLLAGLGAAELLRPRAMQHDLQRATYYAKAASLVLAERLAAKTPRQLPEEFWGAGSDTLELTRQDDPPSWRSPRYLPAGPCVEAWAPVKNGDGSTIGAVIVRQQADAVKIVTAAVRTFAIASCAAFALLAALAWVLFKRRVTDRLAEVVREAGAGPEPAARGADAIDHAREAVKAASERARAKEKHWQERLAAHTELACAGAKDGTILEVNDAYCRFFGKTREQLVGTNYLDLVPPADRAEAVRSVQKLSPALSESVTEHRVLLPDGTHRWVRWRDTAVLDCEGNIKEVLSLGTDITAEKNFAGQNEDLRIAFNQMQSLAETGSITWDFAIDDMEWTGETRRLLGAEASVIPSVEKFIEFVAPEDKAAMRRLFRNARDDGRNFEDEFRVVLADGTSRVLQSRAEVFADPRTKLLTRLACTLRDITALRDAEAATKRELRFREAIEQSLAAGIAVSDEKGRNLLVNPAFCEMTGWSKEELVNTTAPYPYWPEEEIPAINQAFELAIAGKTPPEGFELKFCRKDGARFDVLVKVAPLLDSDDNQLGWLAVVSNISSIQKIRRELQLAEASAREELLFRKAIEQSLDIGIVMRDLSGRTLSVNPAFVRMVGFSEEELLAARPPNEPYWPEREKTNIATALGEALAGHLRPEGFQMVFQRKDGSLFDVLVKVAPLLDSNSKQFAWIGAVNDVSVIQKTRRELAAAEAELRRQLGFREAVEKSTTVGLVVIGNDGRPFSPNDAYCRMLGYSREEVLAWKPPYPCWPDEERENIQRAFRLHLEGKTPPEGFQVRLRRKNGSFLDVLITVSPIFESDGKEAGFLSALTDVTALQSMRRSLQVAGERLQIAQEVAGFGVWDWDPVEDTLFWDRKSFAMFGHPDASDAKEVWCSVHSEEDRTRLTRRLMGLIAEGAKGGQDRIHARWPDGSHHEIISDYLIVRDDAGRPTRVIGVNREVSPKEEA